MNISVFSPEHKKPPGADYLLLRHSREHPLRHRPDQTQSQISLELAPHLSRPGGPCRSCDGGGQVLSQLVPHMPQPDHLRRLCLLQIRLRPSLHRHEPLACFLPSCLPISHPL